MQGDTYESSKPTTAQSSDRSSESLEQEIAARLLNTAIIATKISVKVSKTSNYASQLSELMQNPAFESLIQAIRRHAKQNQLTDERAAEELIQTFRTLDKIWDEYIFHEGLEKLKGHLSN